MTLKEIHAMFAPGQVWIGRRTPGYKPGEAQAETRRKLHRVLTKQIQWEVDGKTNFWSDLPQAREVIEARQGYLKYGSSKWPGVTIGLTQENA